MQKVDSHMSREEAVAAPQGIAVPPHVLENMTLLEVHYIGFDDAEHIGQIVVHRELASEVESFFVLAYRLHFPIFSVIPIAAARFDFDDVQSCIANNSSGFNYRTIMGTNELSKHSFGRAFDINPVQNLYIRFDVEGNEISRLPEDGSYDERAKGTLTDTHPLVTHMKTLGWTWGGDWTKASGRIDYQHFEKMN